MGNMSTWVATEMPMTPVHDNNPSINILHDEVLLEIFDFVQLHGAYFWNHKGWYKLAHTCRRWRHIIFSSPSRLDLQLYCTYGSPVSEILSHVPSLPLIVNFGGRQPLTADDEKAMLLALQKHDRVRHIDIHASGPTLLKLLVVMNGPFPVLGDLMLSTEYPDADEDDEDKSEDDGTVIPCLPPTFRAPHLRSLDLNRVGNLAEQGLPLLASFSGLVSLTLIGILVSIYLPLEYLASRLSLMPHLEHLGLAFNSYISANDSLRKRVNGPITKQISLPYLSKIFFRGESSYLEGLAARIIGSAPLLTNFTVTFLERPSSILSHVSRLLSAATRLRLPVASIRFSGTGVDVPSVAICMAGSEQTLDRWPRVAPFQLVFLCEPLNVQVASAGEICVALTPMFSAVERLHLDFNGGRWEFGPEGDIEDTSWHDLLRPFCNVERLQIDAGLMEHLSVALRPNDDGPAMELLPNLYRLTRPDYTCFGDAFDGFIAARWEAGQEIIKRRRPPFPYSDSEEEDEDDDDSGEDEGEGECEEEEGSGERGMGLGVGDEREGAEEGGRNTNMETDPNSATSDDLEYSTELDSEPDLESEYSVE